TRGLATVRGVLSRCAAPSAGSFSLPGLPAAGSGGRLVLPALEAVEGVAEFPLGEGEHPVGPHRVRQHLEAPRVVEPVPVDFGGPAPAPSAPLAPPPPPRPPAAPPPAGRAPPGRSRGTPCPRRRCRGRPASPGRP